MLAELFADERLLRELLNEFVTPRAGGQFIVGHSATRRGLKVPVGKTVPFAFYIFSSELSVVEFGRPGWKLFHVERAADKISGAVVKPERARGAMPGRKNGTPSFD